MKVRISYKDTATGDESRFDTEVDYITPEAVISAFQRLQTEGIPGIQPDDFKCRALIKDDRQETYAFILSADGVAYFGSFMIVGVIYTSFI